MAELIYNSQRHAYETTLDNGDIFSVDEQAVTNAIKDRLDTIAGKSPFWVTKQGHKPERWQPQDRPRYDEARDFVLDSSIWSEDMEGVSIIHPDGSEEWIEDGKRVVEP